MTVLRNALVSSAGQVAGVLLGLISGIVLARWLGPEDRGAYALIVTSVAVLGLLVNIGLQPAFAFLAGKGRYSPPELGGHVVWFTLAAGLMLAAVLALLPDNAVAAALKGLPPETIWLLLLLTVPVAMGSMVDGILLGMNRVPFMVALNVGLQIVSAVLIIVLLVGFGLGLTGAIVQLVVSAALAVAVAIWVLGRHVGTDLRVRLPLVREAVSFGLRIHPGYVGYSLLSRIDLYFVNYFAGGAATGVYAVAVGLAERLWIVDQSVSQGAIPDITATGREEATELTARAFRMSLWIVVALAVLGALAAPVVIPFVYGRDFAGAAPAFALLMPGIVALTTRIISPFFSMQLGRPEIPTAYGLGVGLLSIPVYWFAIRSWGMLGAAAATSAVYILLGGITIALFVRLGGRPLRQILIASRSDWALLPQAIRRALGSSRVAAEEP